MRMRSFLALGLACSLLACSSEAPVDDERVAEQTAPIVNGSPDTTHQAVVAVIMNGGACSGTIVDVIGSNAYVLTAGHCVDGATPQVVLQGNDYNGNPIQYPVVDWLQHPNYNPPFYDFAMLRVTGAGPSTPKIAAITPAEDNLVAGNQVDIVGYGQTENGNNSVRRHVTLPLAQVTSLLLYYNQQNSGMCFGDSGGGDIRQVGGQDRVVGVNQGVETANCIGGFSDSGRVSAVTDSFIVPFIQGGPVGPQTCDQCYEAQASGVGACVGKVDACLNDAECTAFVDCLQACQTQLCQNQCVSNHALGYQVYKDINECVCTQGCVTECQGDPACPAPPACGFTSTKATCQTCFEGSCCSQMQACANDNFCSACFMKNPPAGCTNSGVYNAANDCLSNNCDVECLGGSVGQGGGGSGPGGSGPGGAGPGGGGPGGAGQGGDATGGSIGTGGDGSGATSSGGGKKKKANDTSSEGGCATSPGGADPDAALVMLALAFGLASTRRRRG